MGTPKAKKTVDIKYLYATVLVAVIVVAAVAGVSLYRPPAAPKTYTIVVIGKSLVPYWATLFKGSQDEGKALGVNIVTWAPQLETVPEQVTKLDEFIGTRPDAILLAASDPYALNPGIDRAQAQGIPVITFDSDTIGSSRIAYICVNVTTIGVNSGIEMVNLLKAKGVPLSGAKVLISTGSVTAENVLSRIKAFKAIMDANGIQIVDTVNNEGDMSKGVMLITTALTAHPDIAGIWGIWANDAPAAAQALRQVGKKPGDVMVVGGVGFTMEVDKDMKDGYISADVVMNTYAFGKYVVQFMYNVLTARDKTLEGGGGGFGWVAVVRAAIPNWPEGPPGRANTLVDLGTSMVESPVPPCNGNLTTFEKDNPDFMASIS